MQGRGGRAWVAFIQRPRPVGRLERVGILIISKCLSGAAIMDAFERSGSYSPDFYVMEKQKNPFIFKRAKAHAVSPDLSLGAVSDFARRHASRIDFGLTDTEDFVTAGGRDHLKATAGVEMVCVSKEFAVERSKADQRLLFGDIFPEANPRYRVFDPKAGGGAEGAKEEFSRALPDFKSPVIKPDAPARGAGVGVWGSDFATRAEAEHFFAGVISKGRVVVEEKVEGEESSFHAFSDGAHFVPAPLVRDYKRCEDGNKGSLTGGMGSYRGPDHWLPFLRRDDYDELASREEEAFRRWKGRGSNPGLRGIVLYDAIMHTGRGFRVLERNSRGGNTELVNLLTTMEDDFADVCYRMLEGSLKSIRFRRVASVATCAVPKLYGTNVESPPAAEEVDLSGLESAAAGKGSEVRGFPMDVRVEDGRTLLGASRSVVVVGLGDDLEAARSASLRGCASLRGPLKWRHDIASSEDIGASAAHLDRLRRRAHASA